MLDMWITLHGDNLYPCREEKERIAKDMSMSYVQVRCFPHALLFSFSFHSRKLLHFIANCNFCVRNNASAQYLFLWQHMVCSLPFPFFPLHLIIFERFFLTLSFLRNTRLVMLTSCSLLFSFLSVIFRGKIVGGLSECAHIYRCCGVRKILHSSFLRANSCWFFKEEFINNFCFKMSSCHYRAFSDLETICANNVLHQSKTRMLFCIVDGFGLRHIGVFLSKNERLSKRLLISATRVKVKPSQSSNRERLGDQVLMWH